MSVSYLYWMTKRWGGKFNKGLHCLAHVETKKEKGSDDIPSKGRTWVPLVRATVHTHSSCEHTSTKVNENGYLRH